MEERKTLQERLEDFKNWAKWKFEDAKNFCSRNKEIIVVFGPVVLGSAIECIKIVTKRGNVKEEKRLKENYIYDRSAGHYYELKRQPKQREWLMIDQRKANGESLGEILMDMRLLK